MRRPWTHTIRVLGTAKMFDIKFSPFASFVLDSRKRTLALSVVPSPSLTYRRACHAHETSWRPDPRSRGIRPSSPKPSKTGTMRGTGEARSRSRLRRRAAGPIPSPTRQPSPSKGMRRMRSSSAASRRWTTSCPRPTCSGRCESRGTSPRRWVETPPDRAAAGVPRRSDRRLALARPHRRIPRARCHPAVQRS